VINRRNLLSLGVAFAAYPAIANTAAIPALAHLDHDSDAFWDKIRNQYNVTGEITNLENGNWGIMSRPVLDNYIQQTEFVNEYNSYYSRRKFNGDYRKIIVRLAAMLDVSEQEIVLTRNATEALQNLITGYNKLQAGDSVLYADLDYGSMQSSMEWLKVRRGVDVIKIDLPEPATYQSIIDTYEKAFIEAPKCRLMLLTHLSHRTGLVVPVKEIIALARKHDIDVILDAAHSWAQLDFTVPDLGVEFAGFNLHKWIGAPVGVGMMYVRKDRIADIDPHRGQAPGNDKSIESRVHTGTVNLAATLSVPKALDFHNMIGIQHKERRLRSLRDMWVREFRDHKRIEILTPNDSRLYGGITSFRIKGKTSDDDNKKLANWFAEKYNVFTVFRDGIAKGSCVRVTPGFYTNKRDIQKFIHALRNIS